MKGMIMTYTYRKQLFVFFISLLFFHISTAQNAIVTENQLAGNPASEWDVSGAGDLSIQGFATEVSVNRGQRVHFKIKTDASAYTISIYRLGYYGGLGARYKGNGVVSATLPQTQPPAFEDPATGLVDCGTWNESGYWDVPSDAVSGYYIARLKRTDNNGASHIVFIVRNDGNTSDLFFQASDATWQAYNAYGGNSLYVGATSYPAGRAVKVSYNRPYITRNGGGGGGYGEDFIFNAEYPMIKFLERNGYDVSYTSNMDIHKNGAEILNHKVFLSVGHDEYWSEEMRTAVENARTAGVHLAFFSGNEIYWKTRYENSADGSNTADRTLVCYKEGTQGENPCGNKCDPTNIWTGLWRAADGAGYGGNRPENALSGQLSWDGTTGSIQVPSAYKNLRFWRNTSIASMGIEDVKTFPYGTLGYEWNYEQTQYAAFNPPGRIRLSNTTLNGKVHKLSMYRHSSGALVFGAGTVQWSWGLDSDHDNGNAAPDQDMQQATVNLLADMSVQPGTLMAGLQAASQSTDNQAPVSIITTPLQGATIPANEPVTIAGTASDNAQVASIEISVDGGTTWTVVSGGNTNWQYTWTPVVQGAIVIKVRGVDDSGNIEAAGTAPAANAINVTVGPPAPPTCPCTMFQTSDAPATTNLNDNNGGIELGMKFKSSVSGYINGIRFYKSSSDAGTHTGSLWDINGNLLGQVIFLSETASGWQEAMLGTPVAITANTTYVVSYHSPNGYYAKTEPFFATDFITNPLIGLADAGSGDGNGVFTYAGSPSFPTNTFNKDNYWVDVVFNTVAGPDVVAPEILSVKPANGAINFPVADKPLVNFNEALDASSVTTANFDLRDAGNNLVAYTVAYNAALRRVTVTPSSNLAYSSVYTLTVKGGTGGVKDAAGNALPADATYSFSTVDPAPGNPGDGPGGPILVVYSASNPFSRFTAEMLRAEGFNNFAVMDISAVDATVLSNYDVVILGEVPVSPAQATMFSTWTDGGGTFISFRPDADLATLLGITPAGGTLADKYILVNTSSEEGNGIVGETIQYHGTADQYTLSGATSLATLYSAAATATIYPAVTTRTVGSNGGKAIAFVYDLPRSIVYTRQGNPSWAGQKRDGTTGPIRSDDMFFDAGGNHWIDFSKVAIPQADEQQRLLSNIILKSNLHRKPLPRFWFLPQGFKAAVVMTGDDHLNNGTAGRFNQYLAYGNNTAQDVKDWKAVRGTSYIYNNTPISNSTATAFEAQGFEIALHPTTDCVNWTESSLNSAMSSQLAQLAIQLPGISAPVTNRTHCMAWSNWAGSAKVSVQNGIRMDMNYYYWPDTWVQNRAGMFTGSGMPMRFADLDGTLVDCYQMVTQMTDESGINYSTFISSLLDKAIGSEGYYGVFTANMHTDSATHIGSSTIIAAAKARNLPVVSARQMLNWLDGRNGSSFSNIVWNNNELSFTVNALINAYKMQGMLPLLSADGMLTAITRNGSPVTFTVQTIKGIQYGFFEATTGNYVASYAPVSFATINGSVTLQGRPAAPNARWSVPLKVDLYANGNTTTPVMSYNITTDQSGNFSIPNVPAGTYTIAVKNSHTLKRVLSGQVLAEGANALNFGLLREGDVNNSNTVSLSDISLVIASFNKASGNAGFDSRADLNNDGIVSISDISLLISNFNTAGENP